MIKWTDFLYPVTQSSILSKKDPSLHASAVNMLCVGIPLAKSAALRANFAKPSVQLKLLLSRPKNVKMVADEQLDMILI